MAVKNTVIILRHTNELHKGYQRFQSNRDTKMCVANINNSVASFKADRPPDMIPQSMHVFNNDTFILCRLKDHGHLTIIQLCLTIFNTFFIVPKSTIPYTSTLPSDVPQVWWPFFFFDASL